MTLCRIVLSGLRLSKLIEKPVVASAARQRLTLEERKQPTEHGKFVTGVTPRGLAAGNRNFEHIDMLFDAVYDIATIEATVGNR